jgi:hypothetical protein
VGRRTLRDEGDRSDELAAHGYPLNQAEEHQQHRGGHADLGVRGQQPEQRGGQRHHRDRELERSLAAQPVTDAAEDDPAERSHHVAGGKDAEGVQQGRDVVIRRKELPPDDGREIAEDGEVVPFEDIADDASDRLPIERAGRRARPSIRRPDHRARSHGVGRWPGLMTSKSMRRSL